MPQRHDQPAIVQTEQPIEEPLERGGDAAGPAVLLRLELRLVAAELGLGLLEADWYGLGSILGEHVAAMHCLALDEVHGLQQPGDLAPDRGRIERLHGAEPGEHDGHVMPLHGGGDDRDGRRRRRGSGRRGAEQSGGQQAAGG